MATSKSDKRMTEWTGGALVFSGRPDPTWPVPNQVANELEGLWTRLKPWARSLPAAQVLGYRGAFLRDTSGREWLAYGGVVTLKAKKSSQSRQDPGRQFEKLLLASAPPRLLPDEVRHAFEGEQS